MDFFDGKPTWLAIALSVFGTTGAVALVRSWMPQASPRWRKRLRRIQYASWCLFWAAVWGWGLTEVESPAKLINNQPALRWLAISAVTAGITAFMSRRVEDRFLYYEPTDEDEPPARASTINAPSSGEVERADRPASTNLAPGPNHSRNEWQRIPRPVVAFVAVLLIVGLRRLLRTRHRSRAIVAFSR